MKLKTLIYGSFIFISLLLMIGTSIGFYVALITKENLQSNHDQYNLVASAVYRLHESSTIINGYLKDSSKSGFVNPQALINEFTSIEKSISLLNDTTMANKINDNVRSMSTDWENVKGAINLINSDQGISTSTTALIFSSLSQFDASLETLNDENERLIKDNLEIADSNFNKSEAIVITSGLAGVIITILVGIYLSRQIFIPLNIIASKLHQMSEGQLSKRLIDFEKLTRSKNELGQLARDLLSVNDYLSSISRIANEMSQGNLSMVTSPRSSEDELGVALNRMTKQLHILISQASDFSQQVNKASYDLSQTVNKTDRDNIEITTSINQISDGIGHENIVANEALTVVERTNSVVEKIGSFAQKQQQATEQAIAATNELNMAIGLVMENAENVATSLDQSTHIVQSGSTMLSQNITSIGQIQQQVNNITGKVKVMGERSHEINLIVDTIEQIASTTNILAINATIEAAHAKIQSEKLTEDILNQMMLSECHMIQHMLDQGTDQYSTQFWKKLCSTTSLDTILVTDGDGVVTFCNEDSLINWRFPDDPNSQTFSFRQLLHQKDATFCQEAQARSLDGQIFKYVGIARKDQPGIIQVGFMMSSLKKFDLHINGFSVVAEEVYHLAERAHTASKDIRKLVTSIQQSTGDVVESVEKSSDYVMVSLQKAENARESIQQVLASIDQILDHTASTMQATKNMQACTRQLADFMDIVGQTVVDTRFEANELGEAYVTIRQKFNQMTSLVNQNSIATVQVKASTLGMKTQMNTMVESSNALSVVSRNLQSSLGKFKMA